MIEEITQKLETWGYLLLFLYCLYGGYVGLIAAATLSSLGKMDITLCIFIAFVANTLGSSTIAYISRHYKAEILPMFAKYSRQIALCQVWLRKYGKISIFVSKYIHIIRFIIPVAIGISRYRFKNFLIYNAIASFIWAVLVGSVTFFSSNVVLSVLQKLDVHPYILPIVLLCWAGVIMLLMRSASKKIRKDIK